MQWRGSNLIKACLLLLLALSGAANAVVFQAESYAYSHDTTKGNTGGAFRSGNTDIEATSDVGGGYNVGWIAATEWLAYSNLVIPATADYTINVRVASVNGGRLSLDLNGGSIRLGEVVVPATGGWQKWTTVSKTVRINAGTYSLGVYAHTKEWNLNWIEVSASTNSGGGNGNGHGPHFADTSRGEWTLVVVPDTQHYSQNRANAPVAHMHKAFDWLVQIKDRLNIQFVQGLGDITESQSNSWEWDNSSSAWYKLLHQMPHMPVQGNHDSIASMNRYFPVSTYAYENWWGGYSSGIENNYALLTIGRENYLFLHLRAHDQYSKPGTAPLAWANQVVSNHRNRKVIVATHDIWATRTIRDGLLSKHDNIIMANAGHDCVREAYYTTTGPNGGVSNNFVADFQCDGQEVMLLRYYIFKPMEDKVDYYTYSPVTDRFEVDSSSQGSFRLLQADP